MGKPIIAITMGDPGGVGPEIIAKCVQDLDPFQNALLLLIGASSVFEFLSEELHLPLPLNPIPTLHRDFLREDSVNFLDISEEAGRLLKNRGLEVPKDELFHTGRVSALNAGLAFASLKAGAYQAAAGLVDALVTAPVSKEAIRLIDSKFVGHTEYLARVARTKQFAMMFLKEKDASCGELRVTLVTIHVPLKKVSRFITEDAVFEKIRLTHDFLKDRLGVTRPRIGVSALNPHGKECGREEEEAIEPAIQRAHRERMAVSGPISGDRIFYEAVQGTFDAIVCMYHDQALAAFKMIAFETGVNLTLGLPYIRTSPDHGPAFDIAYQGKASARSMQCALLTALRLTPS